MNAPMFSQLDWWMLFGAPLAGMPLGDVRALSDPYRNNVVYVVARSTGCHDLLGLRHTCSHVRLGLVMCFVQCGTTFFYKYWSLRFIGSPPPIDST